jgi:hypothetical protein
VSSPREQQDGLPKDVMKHLNQNGLQPSRAGGSKPESQSEAVGGNQYGAPPMPNQPGKSPIGTDRSDENMGNFFLTKHCE